MKKLICFAMVLQLYNVALASEEAPEDVFEFSVKAAGLSIDLTKIPGGYSVCINSPPGSQIIERRSPNIISSVKSNGANKKLGMVRKRDDDGSSSGRVKKRRKTKRIIVSSGSDSEQNNKCGADLKLSGLDPGKIYGHFREFAKISAERKENFEKVFAVLSTMEKDCFLPDKFTVEFLINKYEEKYDLPIFFDVSRSSEEVYIKSVLALLSQGDKALISKYRMNSRSPCVYSINRDNFNHFLPSKSKKK